MAVRLTSLCLSALLLAACSGGGVSPELEPSSTVPDTTTTTAPVPPPCLQPLAAHPAPGARPSVRQLSGDDPVAVAIAVSEATFACAREAVVVSPANLDLVALAARLAAARQGPLLVVTVDQAAAVAAELQRLGPARVTLVGSTPALSSPPFSEVQVIAGGPHLVSRQVNELIGTVGGLSLPAADGALTVSRTVDAIAAGVGLLPAPPQAASTTTTAGSTSSTAIPAPDDTDPTPPDTLPSPAIIEGDTGNGLLWVIDSEHPVAALTTVAAAASGGLMAMVSGSDLRAFPELGRTAGDGSGAGSVWLVGDFDTDAVWQLATVLEGRQLPGGGYLLFPGRRMVALYGSPLTPVLGVLGEQGPEESAERARLVGEPYQRDGVRALPAFEIIATIADTRPGGDGDYSSETDLDTLRPWIDAAEAEGVYVLLDLQPGNSDFLSQAKEYEELLRRPNVGLALDPEWRLEAGQTRFGGSEGVSAAEVNAVEDWLAAIVREDRLPQKMLLLHQFRLTMLPDRDQVGTPPELAVVIQMDGQGALGDKYATFHAVTAGTEGAGWRWGWKNFYHEDSPTPTLDQVLALDPPVVYVSYQ